MTDHINAPVLGRIVDRVREAIATAKVHPEAVPGGPGVCVFPLALERDEAACCHTFKRGDTPEILRALLTIAEQDGDLDNLSAAMGEIVDWRADVFHEERRAELALGARSIARMTQPEAAQ